MGKHRAEGLETRMKGDICKEHVQKAPVREITRLKKAPIVIDTHR